MTDSLKIVPSPRIDYCGECKTEHGFNCPKDQNPDASLGTEWYRVELYTNNYQEVIRSFPKKDSVKIDKLLVWSIPQP